MIKTTLTLFFMLFILLLPLNVRADNVASTAKGEFGFLTGYGSSFVGFGETRHTIQTWDVILRAGFYLSDEVGIGSWYQGRHELLLELPYQMAVNRGGRSVVGGYALGHWRFTSLDKLVPYVLAGGGPLFVDLGLPTMGSKLCFSYQGGTGLQYFIDKKTVLDVEYRYHHISNAGTAEPNEPINSNKLLFGLSYYY
ncbi:MAG: acyloxyacyl hydrolase [Desulfuromonadales bacterium]|nr:acyloxyacyl hydrolase [Desulfuromonadales bacterium]